MATQMSGHIGDEGERALRRWLKRYYRHSAIKEALIFVSISPAGARARGIITTAFDEKAFRAYKRLVRIYRRSKLDTDFAVYQGGISSCHYVP